MHIMVAAKHTRQIHLMHGVAYLLLMVLGFIFYGFLSTPVAAKITHIPVPRPDYTPPPPTPDAVLYQQIFDLQEDAKWKEADLLIRKVRDKSLMGHVYRLRYMHPTAYRASWAEMRDWLQKYGDHPGAWQVYKLAEKRKPRGAKMPKAPPSRVWQQASSRVENKLFRSRASRTIRREIQRLTYRERPTQALKYITKKSIDRQLTAGETDWLRSLIARSYYIEGKPENSYKLAIKATRSRELVPLSDWNVGLAAWRLGRFNSALTHFTYLLDNEKASKRYRAAAGVWAARIHEIRGNDKQMKTLLARAAEIGGNNFYGLLAQQKLNRRIKVAWVYQPPEEKSDLSHHKAIARAEKLLSASQQELAELELLYLGERLGQTQARNLLEIAREKQLPAVELAMTYQTDLGQKFEANEISEGQFPLPGYGPTTGYRIDKAVLYGLIRQESRFKARAKSSAGARGLMQIMPSTAAFVTGDRKLRYRSGRDKLYRISFNMNIGQSYLEGLLQDKQIQNNLLFALASYNAGPGNVRRWKKEIGPNEDPLLFIESLPAPETRHYIQKVMRNIWLYQNKLDQNVTGLEQIARNQWPIYQSQDEKKPSPRQR